MEADCGSQPVSSQASLVAWRALTLPHLQAAGEHPPRPLTRPNALARCLQSLCRLGLDEGHGGLVGPGSHGQVGPPSLSHAWPWAAGPTRRVEGDRSVTAPPTLICKPPNQVCAAQCQALPFDVGNGLLVRRPAGIASCPESPPARAHQSWQSIQVLPFGLPAIKQHSKDKNQAALQKTLPPPRPVLRAGSRPGQSQAPSGMFPLLGQQLLPVSP